MPSDGALLSANTLLATVVVVIVVELSTAARHTDTSKLYFESRSSSGVVPFRFGRLPFIHSANIALLVTALTFSEITLKDNPTSIISAALLFVLLLLPLFEVKEYDRLLQKAPTRLPTIIPASFLFHLSSTILVTYLIDQFPAISIFGAVFYPLLMTPPFLYLLTWDYKNIQPDRGFPPMYQ